MKKLLNENTLWKYITFITLIYCIATICGDMISIYLDKVQMREVINFYVRWLQNILFFSVGIYYLSKINLKKSIILAAILGYFEVDYAFFAEKISPWILNENSNISPEYIRIIIFSLILVALTIKIFFKREKFKDTFLLLSMLGVMGTSILFHIVTTSQLSYFNNQQEYRWQKVYNKNELNMLCFIEHLTCGKIEKNQKISEELVEHIYQNYSIKEYINSSNQYFRYLIASDYNIQNRIQSRKPIAFVKNKDGMFYIYDKENYTQYLKFNELLFGSLSIASHVVWIFGGYFLIWFHSRKKKISLNNNTNVET